MPMNLTNAAPLLGQPVEEATANPGEKREVTERCPHEVWVYGTWGDTARQCKYEAGHEGPHKVHD